MARTLSSFRELMGIDRSIGLVILSRAWTLLAGPLTLFFIGRFLSPAEQGFYYTFNSVVALNIFLELGLSTVLVQFASHEMAHLTWTETGTLSGADAAKRRLAAMFRESMRWYGIVALLACLTVLPAGLFFFSRNAVSHAEIAWRGPWVLLSLMSALNLCLIPLFAVFEGSGKVSTIILVQVIQGIAGSLALWLALALKFALFAAPFYQGASVLVAAAAFWLLFRRCVADLARVDTDLSDFSWWTEVWPFQWKIAVSWLSGYFMFQLFNPVLFAYRGAVEAGRMGMSVTLVNAMQGACGSWVITKAAPFGTLVARKRYKELDRVFFRAILQSSAIFCVGASLVFAGLLYMKHIGHPFANRILDPSLVAVLICCAFMNHVLFAEAVYLRAHKQEPLLWVSVTAALAMGLSTWLLGRSYGAQGMIAGYFIASVVISLGAGTFVFLRKRRQWHTVAREPLPEPVVGAVVDGI